MQQSNLWSYHHSGDEQLRMNRLRGKARYRSRRKYWSKHDKESYTCPDCGRNQDQVQELHVHHLDENPFNESLENLLALCVRCHYNRHGEYTAQTLDEWKEAFLEVGSE